MAPVLTMLTAPPPTARKAGIDVIASTTSTKRKRERRERKKRDRARVSGDRGLLTMDRQQSSTTSTPVVREERNAAFSGETSPEEPL